MTNQSNPLPHRRSAEKATGAAPMPEAPASPDRQAEPSVAPATALLAGLPPIVSHDTVVLILGSFPGGRSLAAGQYYAHPQNQFWKILQAIWPASAMPTGADSYQNRSAWLLERRLGVWDVYAGCRREGSLDTAIRDAVVNDFAGLQLPRLTAIAHNGAESFKHRQRVIDSLARSAPAGRAAVVSHSLPSTSPANATWSFDRKLAAWRALFEQQGLL